jgi:hypothetical protein
MNLNIMATNAKSGLWYFAGINLAGGLPYRLSHDLPFLILGYLFQFIVPPRWVYGALKLIRSPVYRTRTFFDPPFFIFARHLRQVTSFR